MQYMRQEIQEWTNLNFWKRAFKKFEVIWSAEAKHITSNISRLPSTNFTWSILEYFAPYIPRIHLIYLP